MTTDEAAIVGITPEILNDAAVSAQILNKYMMMVKAYLVTSYLAY